MEQYDLLTVTEVAQTLRIHRVTVYRMIRDGHLTAVKPGKAWRIHATSLRAWMTAQTDGIAA